MLSLVLFVILNTSVSIYSTKPWEIFVNRLDLLIKESYLIIQCNEDEIQIARYLTTFEEFESNFQCTNKDQIFQHGIEKIQIIDFERLLIDCFKHDTVVRFQVKFKRVKPSLDKEQNGVEWPYVHTIFTKQIQKTKPEKMEFIQNEEIRIILTEMEKKFLTEEKQTRYFYFEFVNRPMICRIQITGIEKKSQDDPCDPKMIDDIFEPLCFYKVDGEKTLSHQDLNQAIRKFVPYTGNSQTNYTYISNFNTLNDSTSDDGEKENHPEEPNPPDKKKKNSGNLSPNNQSHIQMIVVFIIIIICLIVIIIGFSFLIKKYFKGKGNDRLAKRFSHSSNISNPIESENNLPSSPFTQIQNKKLKSGRQAATNRFNIDEDV